jgi:hypothetical protein
MTMGLERMHAECVSQGEDLLVSFGLIDVWGMAVHADVTEAPKRLGLIAQCFLRSVHFECTHGILWNFL